SFPAVYPPSIGTVTPLICLAKSEQRNITTLPWSSGVDISPAGRDSSTPLYCSGLSSAHLSIAGVIVAPGAIAFIRIFCFPYSSATDLVNPTTPCFEAVYGDIFGDPSNPAPEAVLTIAPPPVLSMALI